MLRRCGAVSRRKKGARERSQKWESAASDGRFERIDGDGDGCQIMSDWVSKSVILEEPRLIAEVTIPPKAIENAGLLSERTSNFGHLGLWPPECDSTGELVIQPK
jgi:hypothetical protein